MILVVDQKGERQAVIEAGKMGIATIGLCDTDNMKLFIDGGAGATTREGARSRSYSTCSPANT